MKTNKQKLDHWNSIIENAGQKFADKFRSIVPERFYNVTQTHISDRVVTGIGYSWSQQKPYVDTQKKVPRTTEVEELKFFAENLPELTKDRVRIYYESKESFGKVSGAIPLTELRNQITDVEEANKIARELIAKELEQKRLMEDGYIKCQYCWKLVPPDKIVKKTMISRMYHNYKKEFSFCSEQCAAHNQMSLEG